MQVCTCHISNLKCKNVKCEKLKNARRAFAEDASRILRTIYVDLLREGFDRKQIITALRREINHKDSLGYDIFEQNMRLISDDFTPYPGG